MINSKHVYVCLAVFMITPHIAYTKSKIKQSMNKLLKRTVHEEIVQKEYPLRGRKAISIKNLYGNITVKSEWDNPTLLLTAVKKAPKAGLLDLATVNDAHSDKLELKIETAYAKNNKKASKVSVDYELVVPHNVRLELIADHGTIKIHEANGQIVAKTCHVGNIEIENAQNSVYAQVEKKGSIRINQAQNNVKAFAHHGNITIHNAKKGIIAQADRGKLDIACLQIPSTSKVSLNTRSGHITLRIPEATNAELQAHTENGTVTCAHYVTVKPLTTQLDSGAWSRFRKEVEGTLGSGEATINAHTDKGNIKILEIAA
jgi:DUF4097 and DUF4098 domain-containing protein YvlB